MSPRPGFGSYLPSICGFNNEMDPGNVAMEKTVMLFANDDTRVGTPSVTPGSSKDRTQHNASNNQEKGSYTSALKANKEGRLSGSRKSRALLEAMVRARNPSYGAVGPVSGDRYRLGWKSSKSTSTVYLPFHITLSYYPTSSSMGGTKSCVAREPVIKRGKKCIGPPSRNRLRSEGLQCDNEGFGEAEFCLALHRNCNNVTESAQLLWYCTEEL
ncbi:hypothetical protein EDB89DRAFT_1908598 [Lactarius sanguifluus]|nr:hypothetical protein EDB89DRAFT_1908598 [Lactarius sanguifluus]